MNKNYNKDKVDLVDDLKIEKIDKKYLKNSGYDFVPRLDHWTNIDEQKIKVKEIEDKTRFFVNSWGANFTN